MKGLLPTRGRMPAKALCNEFGFRHVRQKGCHATLTNERVCVTVPLKEIRAGLLAKILDDRGISRDECSGAV